MGCLPFCESSESSTKKHIASLHIWDILKWHICTILSIAGTVVLIWLNVSKFDIGGEIIGSTHTSADIIGVFQIIVKVHEALIIASLANIARQLIIGDLLKEGIVLGLLGAESTFSTPSFFFSSGYFHALCFGFQGTFGGAKADTLRVHRKVLGLSLFILWACLIASLAGPSSAVLMIPRVDWSFYGKKVYTPALAQNILPNIMINVPAGPSSTLWGRPPSHYLGLEYWDYYFRNSAWNETVFEHFEHEFADEGSTIYTNTTGTYSRELDGEWDGETEISSMIQRGFQDIQDHTWANFRMNDIAKGWRRLQTTINLNTLKATATCRDRQKIPCGGAATFAGNSSGPDWCYKSVNRKLATPTILRSSRDLVLAAGYGDAECKVWITEGPRITANQHYSDTLEVVFEGQRISNNPYFHSGFNLTVCTYSAIIVSGIGTAPGAYDTPTKVQYFDHVVLQNGSFISPRRILFHENWLDYAYYIDMSPNATHNLSTADPFSYSPRPRKTVPGYNLLGMFGNNTRHAGSRWNEVGNQTRATALEVTVGGALTYLLSWVPASDSQYAMPYDQIPLRFVAGLEQPVPGRLVTEYVLRVYREGYIYRLSTLTGYFGFVILCLHAITATLGSLWQVRELILGRGVVRRLMSTPEYTILGAGIAELVEGHQGPGVGTVGEDALKSVIVLQQGLTGPARLALVAKDGVEVGTRPLPSDGLRLEV